MHRTLASSLLLLATSTGCFTIAGGGLPAIQPPAPSAPGTVEATVGDFGCQPSGGGGSVTLNNRAGRGLNDEIVDALEEAGLHR